MNDMNKAEADRREFLKAAGKFAVIVPPAMTFLMATTMDANATHVSGSQDGTSGNNGFGNGCVDGQPKGNPNPNDTSGNQQCKP